MSFMHGLISIIVERIYFKKEKKSLVNFGDLGSGPYYLLGFITFRYFTFNEYFVKHQQRV